MLEEKTLSDLTEMMLEYAVDYLGVKHTKERLLMCAIEDKCTGREVGADDVYEKLLKDLVAMVKTHKMNQEHINDRENRMIRLVEFLKRELKKGIIPSEAVDAAVIIVDGTLPLEMKWNKLLKFADDNKGLWFDESTSEEIAEILED